jgi:hypothetical protein
LAFPSSAAVGPPDQLRIVRNAGLWSLQHSYFQSFACQHFSQTYTIVMFERAVKLASQRAKRRRVDGDLGRSFRLEISTVAKINLSFLWEAFAIASGVPPSTWRTVPSDKAADIQPRKNRFPYRSSQQGSISACKLTNEESVGDSDLPEAAGFEKVVDEFGNTPMNQMNEARINEVMLKDGYRIWGRHCMAISQEGNNDE